MSVGRGRESKFSKNFWIKKLLSVAMANVTRLAIQLKIYAIFLWSWSVVTS